MEFSVAETGETYTATFVYSGGTSQEEVPEAALRTRKLLFEYCQRRLHQLESVWRRRRRKMVYNAIDQDLGKVFELQNGSVVDKSTGRVITTVRGD